MNKQEALDYYRVKANRALQILYDIANTVDEAGKPEWTAWDDLDDTIDTACDSVADILTAITDVEDMQDEEEDND